MNFSTEIFFFLLTVFIIFLEIEVYIKFYKPNIINATKKYVIKIKIFSTRIESVPIFIAALQLNL